MLVSHGRPVLLATSLALLHQADSKAAQVAATGVLTYVQRAVLRCAVLVSDVLC